jgi:hypothetical protein
MRRRSVFSEAALPWRTQVDSQEDFKQFLNKYAGLDVHEPAGWPAGVAKHLTRFKRPNLAIVGITAVVWAAAFKGLPTSVVLLAIGAIAVLGVFGGRGDG